ncbi:MAG: helix-turn-helix transcriptional regulator [Candidatus Omnitrophota bacterium]
MLKKVLEYSCLIRELTINIIISKYGYMSRINLSQQIKKFRTKLKLSQDKLARKAEIPFSTLAKIEAGYTPNPSILTVVKISDALEIGLDELLGRQG